MKRVGLAAFDTHRTTAAYEDLGANIQQTKLEQLNTQLSVFQNALSFFAVEHAAEIRTNPTFRSEFAKMCTTIGIDPLASSSSKSGSLFASLLGKDVNDFYFELAVKVIELCRATRDANGGLISVKQVIKMLGDTKSQMRATVATEDDVVRAVRSCKVLGSGFELIELQGRKMIRSVPRELSTDQTAVLGACEAIGFVSVSVLRDNIGWSVQRAKTVLDDMVASGLLWVDAQGIETEYWAPTWIGH